MTIPNKPFYLVDWEKLNKEAIAGTLDDVLNGTLNGITKKHRSRAGQVVHGMANYVGFLCTFDVPLATQITLLGKWVKWGFDISRPSYLKYVKEIIGEDEYLSYQKRAWMCQRFEAIRAAKAMFDLEKNDDAIALLQERRVIGNFTNRFGNQTVEVELNDVLEFIKIYDHRGFFAQKTIKGSISFERFQERQSTYLKAMLNDLNKTSPTDFVKREKEIIHHGIHKTGVLSNKHMDIDAVVEKAQKRAFAGINPSVSEEVATELPVAQKEDLEPAATSEKKPILKAVNPETATSEAAPKPRANQALYEEVQFNTIKKAYSGKTVDEPFWAFKNIEEAKKEPHATDIKVNDLVLTYGIGGKYFAYRKDKNGEFVMIEKISMHPLMQSNFNTRLEEITPNEMTQLLRKHNIQV